MHRAQWQHVTARWQLPEQLSSAIGYHHQADLYDGPHAVLVHVVQQANIFCHVKDRSPLGVRNSQTPSTRMAAGLELGKEQLVRIWKQVDGILNARDPIATLLTPLRRTTRTPARPSVGSGLGATRVRKGL